jgi:hypothetical protein
MPNNYLITSNSSLLISLYANIKRVILTNGMMKTSKIKDKYDYEIPKTSPIEPKLGDL